MRKLRKNKTDNSLVDTIDPDHNIYKAKALAVSLAFSIAAADKKVSSLAVKVIESWIRNYLDSPEVLNKIICGFHKILARTIAFLPNCSRNRVHIICKEITELAPLAVRCEVLGLCLYVVGANGVATAEQLTLLKNTAKTLEISWERFRLMTEKIVPAYMHETEDMEISLGVTEDMNEDQTRQHLSKEYRKWNARVTNSNRKIKTQAEYMLELIATVRSQCAG